MNHRTMDPQRWARIKALFAAAAELPPSERAAYLLLEATDDAQLIEEVRTLLDSHESASGFLDPLPPALTTAALDAGTAPVVGERIGAYRLVEMIGTGGMGDVYKAVRDDAEYRAEVAIKLMRADVRNPLAEQRFRTERQILAALDHRNIARLLDGGATTRGLPYVVMELVVGEPIDHYCETKSLDTRERVRLFLQVCAAVSFAHQHLVVHRDLKPTNILVTADGSVKLLDFGIAKLLEPETVDAGRTDETRTQLRAMTLDYASPEQVGGSTVTTASDVYSLGVVLYKLLTGESPYGARLNDAQRIAAILGDTTPTRPSAVRTAERPLQDIDTDLDTILLMALRKEPQKRYGSVEQFANDLRAYLNGFPVAARRGTASYRFGKFVRRNRVPIGAGLLVVAALTVGLGVAIREARIANAERATAQRHFDSVRRLATRLFDFHDEVAKLPGSTGVREKLVGTSLEYLDALYQQAGDDVALREELGIAYRKVGEIQGSELGANKGENDAALASYDRSIALLAPLADDPRRTQAHRALATAYLQKANLLLVTGGGARSIETARFAAGFIETHRASWEDEAKYVEDLVGGYWILAASTFTQGNFAEARPTLDRMVKVAEEFQKAHPHETPALGTLSDAYNNVAIAIGERVPGTRGQDEARAYYQKSADLLEALLAKQPGDARYTADLAGRLNNIGDTLFNAGRFREAVHYFRRALPALRVRGEDADDVRGQWAYALIRINIAKCLVKIGDFDEAATLLDGAESSLLAQGARGDNLRVLYSRMEIDSRRGELFYRRGDLPKARASLTAGIAHAVELNKSFKLEGPIRATWDEAEALLVRIDAALARTR